MLPWPQKNCKCQLLQKFYIGKAWPSWLRLRWSCLSFLGSKANFTDETHNYRIWRLCNSTEKLIFQELLLKIAFSLPTKWEVFCECTHWPFGEVFNGRISALCISLKIKNIKKAVSFCPLFLCDREVEGMYLDNWMIVRGGGMLPEKCAMIGARQGSDTVQRSWARNRLG